VRRKENGQVVTLGRNRWALGRPPPPHRYVLPYILSQCVGAVAASLMVRALFGGHPTLGVTLPSGPVLQSFVLEIILAFLLMFVILCVSTGDKEKGGMAGAAVGAVIGLEALFAGPISGASMNSARSFGPALVTGHLDTLWIYLLDPVIGASLAILGCRCIQKPGCCRAPQSLQEELS